MTSSQARTKPFVARLPERDTTYVVAPCVPLSVRNHTDTHSHSHKHLHAPRRARTWAVYVSRLTPEFFNQFCSGGCRGSRPSSEPSSSVRGCGENLGLAPRLASRHYHKAAVSSALADWRTRGAQIHGKRPPSRPLTVGPRRSVYRYHSLRSFAGGAFHGRMLIACPSRYFPCMGVSTRPCSGRRAVAVLGGQ